MSIWTHTIGYIKFASKIEKSLLGNTVSWGDRQDVWDSSNVPLGSEGSINIISLNDPSSIFRIKGDLRDYHYPHEIYGYFDSILARSKEKELPKIKNISFTIRINSFKVFFILKLDFDEYFLECCSEDEYDEYTKI